jgi:predicted nucleotidyltransferase component of viral defense system
MSLFDALVDEALRTRADLALLRPVVEKELLHHDILREMSGAGLLAGLTFIGGTCLRACYGSPQLSEDLDFTGGVQFNRSDLADLGEILQKNLQTRYGLRITVGDPVKEEGRVSTWKMSVETRPGRKEMPAQRIHLDICSIPSHDARPMMLRNIYGVEMGTSGLILQAQSREEILADKVVALALRKNSIKNRYLWDILWLLQQGVELPHALLPLKLEDHQCAAAEFTTLLRERVKSLGENPAMRTDFLKEMRRFLPSAISVQTVELPQYWEYLARAVEEVSERALRDVKR